MNRPSSNLRVAASFLTRVPLHRDGVVDLPRAVPWFPMVGVIIGVALAGVWWAAREVLPSGPAAALALVAGALLTGAFHHDGLADIADAFGGGWTVEQRLEILKDSRHGTYGVTALVLSILVQWSSLASLTVAWGAAGLVGAHVLGRVAILVVLLVGRPARREGLGIDHSAGLSRPRVLVGVLAGSAAAGVALGAWVLVAVAAAVLAGGATLALATRKIGGFSGDVLGAVEQVGECAVLLATAAVASRVAAPWWA